MNIININNLSLKDVLKELQKIPKWLGSLLVIVVITGFVYFSFFKSSTKELEELKLIKKELKTLKVLDDIVNDNTEYITTFIDFNVKCLKKIAPENTFDSEYVSTVYSIQEHYIKSIDKKRLEMNDYIKDIDEALVKKLDMD